MYPNIIHEISSRIFDKKRQTKAETLALLQQVLDQLPEKAIMNNIDNIANIYNCLLDVPIKGRKTDHKHDLLWLKLASAKDYFGSWSYELVRIKDNMALCTDGKRLHMISDIKYISLENGVYEVIKDGKEYSLKYVKPLDELHFTSVIDAANGAPHIHKVVLSRFDMRINEENGRIAVYKYKDDNGKDQEIILNYDYFCQAIGNRKTFLFTYDDMNGAVSISYKENGVERKAIIMPISNW